MHREGTYDSRTVVKDFLAFPYQVARRAGTGLMSFLGSRQQNGNAAENVSLATSRVEVITSAAEK
jgi:hypothetical protein